MLGSHDPGHAELSKKLFPWINVLLGLFLGARTPNTMFVSFAVTELLAFNLQIFMESRDPDDAPFTRVPVPSTTRDIFQPQV